MDDELVLKTVPLGSLEEALAWGPGVRLVDSACRVVHPVDWVYMGYCDVEEDCIKILCS